MVVMGNPPYSGESANKGEWIMGLMEDYKKEPGGKEKLKEKNSKWINDDYVKFLRYGQQFIEKNGEGILAYINPHSFLDNPTFRGMRWNLLKTYDKIYTIDLHGNSKKKEICPDGTADINIFDIQQGVSINIFIKTGKKKANELGKYFHFDLFGKREMKYNFLSNNSLKTVPYKELENIEPNYFFMEKDFSLKKIYEKGLNIKKLFSLNGVGICSKRDKIAFQEDKKVLLNVLRDFKELSEADLKIKYKIKSESRDQKVCFAKQNIFDFGIKKNYITKINYRPFDYKWTYYTNKVRGFIAYPVYNIMKHFLNGNNFGLITNRQCQTENYQHTFITNTINDLHITETANANPYTFPLYLYPETNGQQSLGTNKRTPNLNTEIVKQIAEKIDLTFTNEKEETEGTFAPIDILDYIYAVLHSPRYREKYKEFLKIDFARIPYPENKVTFWHLVKLGGELRTIHLLDNPIVEKYITSYPISGSNIVEKPEYKGEKVFINKKQYFDNVPEIAWNFYIGGYRPAQKWMKDRKGKDLSVEDIFHYQKIIVALTETDRIMREIDKYKLY